MGPSNFEEPVPAQETRAAVFVDYKNLYDALSRELGEGERPEHYITEMLEELHRYLTDQDYKKTAIIMAYADFSQLRGNGQALQRSLYMLGAEPRFVPATMQENASEIQLCVDAMDVLHNRPDVRSFVLMTGDRAYLPLVQQFRRHGRDTFVATLSPPATAGLPPEDDNVFFDAHNLLSTSSRQQLGRSPHERPVSGPSQPRDQVAPRETEADPAHHTLEIIEEYFGQYEEVYLTPLLRKLSELLGREADPKSIVSDLEEHEAVRLEKRSGSPHDYTVLLVNDEHPTVQKVHEQFYSEAPAQGGSFIAQYRHAGDAAQNRSYDGVDHKAPEEGPASVEPDEERGRQDAPEEEPDAS